MNTYQPNPNYHQKKIDGAANFAVHVVRLLNYFYKIEYKHQERLYPLADKPFVLLPRHQHWFDIPLDGMLLKRALNRYGNYVMKASLPKIIFEPLGGITIIRQKDLEKLTRKNLYTSILESFPVYSTSLQQLKKKAFKDALKEANHKKNRVYSYHLPNLLSRDEIIVLYIDGVRLFNKPVEINHSNLKKLQGVQHTLQKPITIVPLDSKYDLVKRTITLTVGRPIEFKKDNLEEIVEHLKTEVKTWY